MDNIQQSRQPPAQLVFAKALRTIHAVIVFYTHYILLAAIENIKRMQFHLLKIICND